MCTKFLRGLIIWTHFCVDHLRQVFTVSFLFIFGLTHKQGMYITTYDILTIYHVVFFILLSSTVPNFLTKCVLDLMIFLIAQCSYQVLIQIVLLLKKKFPNKWVFNFDLNMVNDSDCMVLAGNAFHILRSAAKKIYHHQLLRLCKQQIEMLLMLLLLLFINVKVLIPLCKGL